MNYDQAQQYCNDNGAKLFEPKNNALNNFVMEMARNHSATRNIGNTGTEYWIGIRNHDQYSSDNSTTCWSRYSPLNKVVGAGDCDNNAMCTSIIIIGFGTVGAGLESFGLWQDQCCSLKMYSACDKQIGESSYIFLSHQNTMQLLNIYIYLSPGPSLVGGGGRGAMAPPNILGFT